MKKLIETALALWNESLPGRILNRFNERHGGVLASGMSFSAIFSVFAAVWIGIGVYSFFLSNSPVLWETLLNLLNTWIPGLFDLGSGGAINPHELRPTVTTLSWTGAIAVIALLFTALGWLEATRSSIYAIMDLPNPDRNVLLTKVYDILLLIGFGLLILITAVSAFAAGAAADWLSDLTDFGGDQELISEASIRIIGFSVNFVFNIAVLLMLFKVLAAITPKFRTIWVQLMVGAFILTVIQGLGSALLGGASRNPLLATFAVLIGLLIWFNLISRIILLIAAWIAESKNVILEPKP